jgi:hypothetical protein
MAGWLNAEVRLDEPDLFACLQFNCTPLSITNVRSIFLGDVVWFVWFMGILGGVGA